MRERDSGRGGGGREWERSTAPIANLMRERQFVGAGAGEIFEPLAGQEQAPRFGHVDRVETEELILLPATLRRHPNICRQVRAGVSWLAGPDGRGSL